MRLLERRRGIKVKSKQRSKQVTWWTPRWPVSYTLHTYTPEFNKKKKKIKGKWWDEEEDELFVKFTLPFFLSPNYKWRERTKWGHTRCRCRISYTFRVTRIPSTVYPWRVYYFSCADIMRCVMLERPARKKIAEKFNCPVLSQDKFQRVIPSPSLKTKLIR